MHAVKGYGDFMNKVVVQHRQGWTYLFTFRLFSCEPVVPDPSICFKCVFGNRAVGSGSR
jgi:hypothetical protein